MVTERTKQRQRLESRILILAEYGASQGGRDEKILRNTYEEIEGLARELKDLFTAKTEVK